MKLAFQLAYKNLMGAGLRTWLNVVVLSFAFVLIIFYNGLIDGWNEQARTDGIAWEYGNGQLRHADYDPMDPFTLQDAHGVLPFSDGSSLVPILISQATVYPQGRMMSAQLKGIDAHQTLLKLPTQLLNTSKAEIPVLVGKRMAEALNVEINDEVLLRWRDKNGTFDAASMTIAGIFDTHVPSVDGGQIWLSIEKLQKMTDLPNEATLFVANESYVHQAISGWKFESQESLLKELTSIIEMKKVSGSIMYGLLLTIALLAIFDTQVLSIFRRQREIGTYIALGMTRWQVVSLFTVEGSMYSFLAALLGAVWGIPLLLFAAWKGFALPAASTEMGLIVADRIHPVYGIGLIVSTLVLVVAAATLVSFLPSRKIAKMNPVDALKGKML
jgi:ABC-type lipoprotein release transport system permease subunit